MQQAATLLLAACLALALSACGGGCSDCSADTGTSSGATNGAQAGLGPDLQATAGKLSLTDTPARPSRQAATRFLTQASFGPTPEDVNQVMGTGYAAWLDAQFAAPMHPVSHVAGWDASNQAIMRADAGQRASSGEVVSSFWRQALTGQDQLRQRVAFALSEIFVVSIKDSCGDNAYSRGVAGYMDMLSKQAFGSYRDLLEAVTRHPIMACYLSMMKNQAEDLSTGRLPDENFAREVMQLFSIGLLELNMDGSPRLDASGQAIETYGPADISGLAKVFTGWSWRCAAALVPTCFFSNPGEPEQYVQTMLAYPRYHSTSEKRFLNTVIPANWFSTPESDLAVALDQLAGHPNVGPFIGKQLIQRLVTSNPSPAYVQRVAMAFKASGGSMKEMVRAILMDTEARSLDALASTQAGKVREPVLRLSALMRAVGVQSDSGLYLITSTLDPGQSLAQSPMASPSVFNFFRPTYTRPGSRSAAAGLVAPELQIATETSAAGYVNFMTQLMWAGAGRSGYDGKRSRLDIQLKPNLDAAHPLLPLADTPAVLVEELNQRLMYGTMPAALASEISQAVAAVNLPTGVTVTDAMRLQHRRQRLWSALLLTSVSPEFQIQK